MTNTKPTAIEGSGDLLPDPLVARRYGVSSRTVDRWDHQPDLDFPPPYRINRRKYRRISELEDWERRRVGRLSRKVQHLNGED